MAKQVRIKTKYVGVYLVDSISPATGKPDQIVYIRYRKDGKLIEEKAGRTSVDAMTPAKAAQIRAFRMTGKSDPNTVRRAKIKAAKEAEDNSWTIDRLWAEYLSVNGHKKRIVVTDKYRFSLYLQEPFGSKTPDEIDSFSVDRLRITLGKVRKPATVHGVLELLRRIINFGVKRGLCQDLPFKMELPRLNNQKTEDLTPDQLQALLQAIEEDPHPVAGPMMLCALFTGMRRGEMFKLKWTDLDFERGFIVLRDPKGGSDQTIPMNSMARRLFELIPRESEFVFPGRGGQQRTTIKTPVNRIKQAADLPEDFRPLHGLRHVYASMLASSGKVDMYTLQKLMTHKSSAMTQRYAHLRDEALQRAGNVVEDIFKGLGQEKAIDSGKQQAS